MIRSRGLTEGVRLRETIRFSKNVSVQFWVVKPRRVWLQCQP